MGKGQKTETIIVRLRSAQTIRETMEQWSRLTENGHIGPFEPQFEQTMLLVLDFEENLHVNSIFHPALYSLSRANL